MAADETVHAQPQPKVDLLQEHNKERMKQDLDTLTEVFVELYLEANPKMAQAVGRA
jgi:hypothetical protein